MNRAVVFLLASLVFLAGCVGEVKKSETTTTVEAVTTTKSVTTTTTKATTTVASTTIPLEEPLQDSTTTTSTSSAASSTTTTTVNAVCASDDDCPKAFNSSKYCWEIGDYWNGDDKSVYMDEVEYVCSGKGTPNARCAEVRERQAVERCVASNCFNGDCYRTHCFNQHIDDMEEQIDCGIECPDCSLKPNITCFNDCDCLSREGQLRGTYYQNCKINRISASELVPEGRCYDRTIFQNLISYKCMKPGTVNSYCTSSFTQQMVTASCRDKNCTLDCRFKTPAYPNLAIINNVNVSFASIE